MNAPELQREYAAHAAAKEARLRQLLGEQGLAGLFQGMERCPLEEGYRAHAIFRVEHEGAGEVILGVDPRHARVPYSESLWVLPAGARGMVHALAELLRGAGALARITAFELHLEHGSPRAHLTLAAPRTLDADLAPLCRRLLEELPELLGVAVPSQGIELGEAYLRNRLGGKTILAHHRAFFQSNLRLVPRLVQEIQDPLAAPAGIVDLYCGVGLHSLLAAAPGSWIEGADSNRWAIESACRNAGLHGLAQARYRQSAAAALAAEPMPRAPSVLFINPSRGGCEPGVPEAAARREAERICLISCALESHLRDLRAFATAGYRPLGVRSFDMFPFTPFVESVSFLAPG